MPAADFSMHVVNPIASGRAPEAAKAAPADDFSFSDLLDVINPLQHIPVVSTLYRKITGDQMGTPAKIAGDTLYGGPLGFLSSVADTAFEKITGKDFGDTVLALFDGDDSDTKLASATPSATPQASASESIAPDAANAPPAALQNSPATVATGATSVTAQSEETITAMLNRGQLQRALAARMAYSQATLSRPTGIQAASL